MKAKDGIGSTEWLTSLLHAVDELARQHPEAIARGFEKARAAVESFWENAAAHS
ncbi:MAG TPA: hypothetical protein HPP83_08460 [Candidatus Hydrogenedentes bacterium]|nr:hypothetical protein [Candidatus Hydrogenedentota bacterium]